MTIFAAGSMEGALASLGSQFQGDQLRLAIGAAVLKQVQDSQRQQAEALLEMMRNTPPPVDGTGSIINLSA